MSDLSRVLRWFVPRRRVDVRREIEAEREALEAEGRALEEKAARLRQVLADFGKGRLE